MKASPVKFYLIKLLLLLIATLLADAVVYIAGLLLKPFESIPHQEYISYGIAFVFFLCFMFTVESRIKFPDNMTVNARYFALFTLREASVYAIFLIPTLLLSPYGDMESIYALLMYLYLPHILPLFLGMNEWLYLIAMTVIYACVAFSAHLVNYKRASALTTVDDNEVEAESKSDTRDIEDGE